MLLLGVIQAQASGAGGGGAAYDLLETQVLASSASSVTFTGLDTLAAGYQHLQLRMTARNTATASGSNFRFRFNADSGANYSAHFLYGTGSSVPWNALTNRTQIDGMLMPDDNLSANAFAGVVMDILDFSSTSKAKTIRKLGGFATATSPHVYLTSGRWGSLDAITSIEVFSSGTSFITGSRFSIYGVK